MKALVFWGGGSPDLARRRRREGAVFLLWGSARGALDSASIPFRTADLTPPQAEGVERSALRWCRAWPRIPLVDGRSFRELLEWKGTSLADLVEDFWLTSPRLPDFVRLIETLELLLEAEAPDEVEAVGLAGDAALLLSRACTRRGILYHGPEPRRARAGLGASLRGRARALGMLARALGVSLSGGPPRPAGGDRRPPVLFFLSGNDPLPEVREDPGLFPVVVALEGPGPGLEKYLAGRALREVRAASRRLRETWSRLRRSPALGDAFSHRGVAFADLAQPDLAELMLAWLPRAVRQYEQASAALRAVRPAVVCLGRTPGSLLLACRDADVPTVERQSGEAAASLFARLRAAANAHA